LPSPLSYKPLRALDLVAPPTTQLDFECDPLLRQAFLCVLLFLFPFLIPFLDDFSMLELGKTQDAPFWSSEDGSLPRLCPSPLTIFFFYLPHFHGPRRACSRARSLSSPSFVFSRFPFVLLPFALLVFPPIAWFLTGGILPSLRRLLFKKFLFPTGATFPDSFLDRGPVTVAGEEKTHHVRRSRWHSLGQCLKRAVFFWGLAPPIFPPLFLDLPLLASSGALRHGLERYRPFIRSPKLCFFFPRIFSLLPPASRQAEEDTTSAC